MARFSSPPPVFTLGKGRTSEIRGTLQELHGVHVLDLRTFNEFSAAKLMSPTARGVAIPLDQLLALAEGVNAALTEARARGLIGGVHV